jgi:hypothetical protein
MAAPAAAGVGIGYPEVKWTKGGEHNGRTEPIDKEIPESPPV